MFVNAGVLRGGGGIVLTGSRRRGGGGKGVTSLVFGYGRE